MVIETIAQQLNISPLLLAILIVWSLFWKALGLWKSARINQPVWFVVLFVVNTLGILEVLYLFIFSRHVVSPTPKISNKRKK